jgi:hypothetical protein
MGSSQAKGVQMRKMPEAVFAHARTRRMTEAFSIELSLSVMRAAAARAQRRAFEDTTAIGAIARA